MQQITERLLALQDLTYRDFNSKLIPTVNKENILGVRTPNIRKLSKELSKNQKLLAEEFLKELPHKYLEENHLHGLLIGDLSKNAQEALYMIDEFLPYVDNWATCDGLPPKILKSDLRLLRKTIYPWLDSSQVYRVRFSIVAMLTFLLDEEFEEADLIRLANIHTDQYYINMAIAWYYSFALIKQYDFTIKVFENRILDKWIHNKSIQKAIESYRISNEQKAYLRTLKIK
jgi:3-methyladenine DNA glycosylase AlkD